MTLYYVYLFSPVGLEVIPSINQHDDVVYSIDYQLAAVGERKQAYAELTTVLTPPQPEDGFIDYEQISEATLVSWIEGSEPRLPQVKADLDVELAELEAAIDTVLMPLPWEIEGDYPETDTDYDEGVAA